LKKQEDMKRFADSGKTRETQIVLLLLHHHHLHHLHLHHNDHHAELVESDSQLLGSTSIQEIESVNREETSVAFEKGHR